MNLTTQFQAAFDDNKKAAKSYKTYDKADQVAQAVVQQVREDNDPTLRYLVIYLPKLERFSICFLMTEWYNAKKEGGYLGLFAQMGHFSI